MVWRLRLRDALGLGAVPRLAAVGAGGKTTFLFRIAREYSPDVLLTTSTHLAVEQAHLANVHQILHSQADIDDIFQRGIHGITLLTCDEVGDGRLGGLTLEWLERIAFLAKQVHLPLLIEADGSRRLPIKAPASHEPVIPSWVNVVVVCAGLSGIGAPIDADHFHRPEIVAKLTGQVPGSEVTSDTIANILMNPAGGLKNIPAKARKIALINQADNELLEAVGGRIARELVTVYDTVMVASLQNEPEPVKAVFSSTAAIILAAGRSTRFDGRQKVLLDWFGEPFIRHIAETALDAHLQPVVVIAGVQYREIRQALEGLAVVVLENKEWESGQSTSIQTGLKYLPENVRSVVFLLADQPQVSTTLLTALVERNRQTGAAIVAPLIEDRRANPVLFDNITFGHLLALQGDTGGRAIFSKFKVEYMPWLDRLMLLDVDTQEDYDHLITAYGERYDK